MSNTNNYGVGTLGLLGIVFITLKLTGFIDWSWWWVLLPYWGGIALLILGFVIYIIVMGTKHTLRKGRR